MDEQDLEVASEFCRLVESSDLFEYLGLEPDCSPEEAKEALAKKRRYMQGMQGNPKFKDSAGFLIKKYRALERVLEDPTGHLEWARRQREDAKLPMLVFALDSMMADGDLSPNGEAFIRRTAIELGFSEARFEEVLAERAAAMGAVIARQVSLPGPRVEGDTLAVESTADGSDKTLRGADGHGWWDATFTRMLLETIPGGPGEMVDVYCRTALSALTLLPERRQLTYLGIDRSVERIEAARDEIGSQSVQHAAARITLAVGTPHKLPIPDESVDYVLAIRALANLSDTRPVFREAVRVLRPGGRMIVAEPDGLGEVFYYDGHLNAYNAAFHQLCVEVNASFGASIPPSARPGLSIGPTLPARMQEAGLRPGKVRVHASANLRDRGFKGFAKRLRGYPDALARTGGIESSWKLKEVLDRVDELETRYPGEHRGLAGNVLPMFLVAGIKD